MKKKKECICSQCTFSYFCRIIFNLSTLGCVARYKMGLGASSALTGVDTKLKLPRHLLCCQENQCRCMPWLPQTEMSQIVFLKKALWMYSVLKTCPYPTRRKMFLPQKWPLIMNYSEGKTGRVLIFNDCMKYSVLCCGVCVCVCCSCGFQEPPPSPTPTLF